MAFLHCNQETIVLETRGTIRKRKCKLCNLVFTTEEVMREAAPLLTPAERRASVNRNLLECPVDKKRLKEMLDTYPSIKAIATDLFVSTSTLNRWLRENDL